MLGKPDTGRPMAPLHIKAAPITSSRGWGSCKHHSTITCLHVATPFSIATRPPIWVQDKEMFLDGWGL